MVKTFAERVHSLLHYYARHPLFQQAKCQRWTRATILPLSVALFHSSVTLAIVHCHRFQMIQQTLVPNHTFPNIRRTKVYIIAPAGGHDSNRLRQLRNATIRLQALTRIVPAFALTPVWFQQRMFEHTTRTPTVNGGGSLPLTRQYAQYCFTDQKMDVVEQASLSSTTHAAPAMCHPTQFSSASEHPIGRRGLVVTREFPYQRPQ